MTPINLSSQNLLDVFNVDIDSHKGRLFTHTHNKSIPGFSLLKDYPINHLFFSFQPLIPQGESQTSDSAVLLKVAANIDQYHIAQNTDSDIDTEFVPLFVSAQHASRYLLKHGEYNFNDPKSPSRAAVKLLSKNPPKAIIDTTTYVLNITTGSVVNTLTNATFADPLLVFEDIYDKHVRSASHKITRIPYAAEQLGRGFAERTLNGVLYGIEKVLLNGLFEKEIAGSQNSFFSHTFTQTLNQKDVISGTYKAKRIDFHGIEITITPLRLIITALVIVALYTASTMSTNHIWIEKASDIAFGDHKPVVTIAVYFLWFACFEQVGPWVSRHLMNIVILIKNILGK